MVGGHVPRFERQLVAGSSYQPLPERSMKKRRLRLGLITPGFSADEQDWAIPVLHNLFAGLADRHALRVFALRYPPAPRAYTIGKLGVRAIGGGQSTGLARLPLLLRSLQAIYEQARHEPFDLLHAFWADEPGFVAAAAGRLLRIPIVVSLMGGELVGLANIAYGSQLSRLNPFLIRTALGSANRVTAGSLALKRLAAGRQPTVDPLLLPLGVDTQRFRPGQVEPEASPLRAGSFNLLQVASLSPVKDHPTALRALQLLHAQGAQVHLHLVGEGPAEPEVRRTIAGLGLEAQVTLHGWVPHDRMPDYYRAADVCLLTSVYEAQAMTVLEAAACGRPVVGTAVGVLPELAPAAQLVPVGNERALAEAILALIDDPARRRRLGAAGRSMVMERYGLNDCLDSMDQVYHELAA